MTRPPADITSDGANWYLYDAEGRVCAVASTPVSGMLTMTGYVYNADGVRVSKGSITSWSCNPATNGFSTINDYEIGPNGQQLTEMGRNTDNSIHWQRTYVYAGGQLIGTYQPDGLHYRLTDWLGTLRATTTSAGVLEGTCTSLPFGDGEACNNSPDPHQFTSKERDIESGNDYFGARYYSSAMARFMSPDWSAKAEPVPYAKLDDPQSLNLYAYLMGKPLSGTDLDGHCPQWMQAACTSWNRVLVDWNRLDRSATLKFEIGFGWKRSYKAGPFEGSLGISVHDEKTYRPGDKPASGEPVKDIAEGTVSGKLLVVGIGGTKGYEHTDGSPIKPFTEKTRGLGAKGVDASGNGAQISLGFAQYWFVGGGVTVSADQPTFEKLMLDLYSTGEGLASSIESLPH